MLDNFTINIEFNIKIKYKKFETQNQNVLF